jgi:hypothetical protein
MHAGVGWRIIFDGSLSNNSVLVCVIAEFDPEPERKKSPSK